VGNVQHAGGGGVTPAADQQEERKPQQPAAPPAAAPAVALGGQVGSAAVGAVPAGGGQHLPPRDAEEKPAKRQRSDAGPQVFSRHPSAFVTACLADEHPELMLWVFAECPAFHSFHHSTARRGLAGHVSL